MKALHTIDVVRHLPFGFCSAVALHLVDVSGWVY